MQIVMSLWSENKLLSKYTYWSHIYCLALPLLVPSRSLPPYSVYTTCWATEARSWLKLLRMTNMPLPSLPSVFDSGTQTLSNVTNAVPAVAEYAVLIGLVESPSQRGTKMTVYPPSVLHPTVK